MDNELISIIVPVYNSEKYLSECIESILCQTYPNFELLLINDGSTDSSLDICKMYAVRDNRVILINKSNSGVSPSRNLGIENAKGDWITFVDSDDFLTENYLLNFLPDNFIDILLALQPTYTYTDNNIKPIVHFNNDKTFVSLMSCGDYNLIDNILNYGTISGKLYNRNIILKFNLKFDEKIENHEDTIFFYKYITHINNSLLYISNIDKYYYRICFDDKQESLSKRLPVPDEMTRATKTVIGLYQEILEQYNISGEMLYNTQNFIQYLKMRCIRSVFKYTKDKVLCKKILNSISKKDISKYYAPSSFKGYILKYIVLLPNKFSLFALKTFKDKL